jgi:hypothetical protein
MNIEYFVEEHNNVRKLVHLHILDLFLKLKRFHFKPKYYKLIFVFSLLSTEH